MASNTTSGSSGGTSGPDKKASENKASTEKTATNDTNSQTASSGGGSPERHRKSSAKPTTIDLEAKTVSDTADKAVSEEATSSTGKAPSSGASAPKTPDTTAQKASEKEPSEAAKETAPAKSPESGKSPVSPKGSEKASEVKSDAAASAKSTSTPKAASSSPSTSSAKSASTVAAVSTNEISGSGAGSGAGRTIFSAFIGAIIAILVFFALISWGGVEIGVSDDTEVADLEEQLDALKAELAALQSAEAPAMDTALVDAVREDLTAEVDSLRGAANANADEITNLKSALETAGSATALPEGLDQTIADLSASVEQNASALAGLSSVDQVAADLDALRGEIMSGAAGEGPATSELSGQLSELASKVTGLADQVTTLEANTDALGAPQADLQEALAEQAAQLSGQIEALASQLSGLVDRVTAAEEAVATSAESLPELSAALAAATASGSEQVAQIESLAERLEASEQGIETLGTEVAEGVATLGARLDAIEGDMNSVTDRDRAAAAVAVSSLQVAIRSGKPFTSELGALTALASAAGVDPTAFDGLQAFAETGLTTDIMLLSLFRDRESAMVNAATTDTASEGVMDRLMASARSVVQIRAVGPVEGNSVAAIVSRLDAALISGDLPTALSEYEALPETSRAQAEQFGADLRARVQADELTRDVMAGVIATLAGAEGE